MFLSKQQENTAALKKFILLSGRHFNQICGRIYIYINRTYIRGFLINEFVPLIIITAKEIG